VTSALPAGSFASAYSFYAKQAEGSAMTAAESAEIWSTIMRIGNGGDFFYARPLWWLRRAIDWIAGGPSFRRRRRDPDDLRVGDVLDSWRVIAIEPEKKLTLLMEMRAPGAGVLEFEISDKGEERRISVHAYWHPAGAWGLLYWYAVLPAHLFIFNGTAKAVARRSERA
jgi:hypothetical protein